MAKLTNERKSQLRKAISELEGLSAEDKSALIELLNTHKKYGLVWEDKPEDVEEALREKLPLLTEVKERAIVYDSPESPNHILIEGDNLEALTALSYTHEGKVDVIYIDPPYNTGNQDFRYNDKFVDKEDDYRHSKWLSFMSKRLRLAKRLLSDKGVIFISIDQVEVINLSQLCNGIFGHKNNLGLITLVNNLKGRSDDAYFATCNEFMLVYANKTENVIIKSCEIDSEEIDSDYVYQDEKSYYKPTGFRKTGKGWRREDRPNMYYPVLLKDGVFSGVTKDEYEKIYDARTESFDDDYVDCLVSKYEKDGFEVFLPYDASGQKGRWRWGYYDKFKTNHKTELCVNAANTLCVKMRATLEDGTIRGKLQKTTWYKAEYDTGVAQKSLTNLLGGGKDKFENPKSVYHIKDVLNLFDSKILILDFFAGSGTTLHATMQLNAEDGGKRKCILVTNNENKICEEVTYERNKRVINGYTTPKGEKVEGLKNNSLRYYKTKLMSRERTIKNMRALMAVSTELVCIKNDLYAEQEEFFGRKLNKDVARYFDDRRQQMLIVYNEQAIESIIEVLREVDVEQRIKIYLFSNNGYAYNDNFEEVLEKVELCALPAAIYNAYEYVLPKKKEEEND